MPEGKNSALAAVLNTDRGSFFVKGLRQDDPRRRTQDIEALIGPHVAEIAPRFLFRHQSDRWDLLVFEAVDGRHAGYSPGSPDLVLLVESMAKLGGLPCPDIPIKHAEQRWTPYVIDPRHTAQLRGDALLHTDYAPDNVLISRGKAVLVDWAWPTRGAGWIDPACLILRLIAAGHTPTQAERVVEPLPAWTTAPEEAMAVFAHASLNLWKEIATHDQSTWTKNMELAAREWAAFRT